MPASLDDLLSAQKNGVIAINNLARTTLRGQGSQTSATVTSATLIYAGAGYLVNFAVVVAGTGDGAINNAVSTNAAAANNVLCTTTTTVGVYPVGQAFTNGLVIVPGTGQSINVTYSVG